MGVDGAGAHNIAGYDAAANGEIAARQAVFANSIRSAQADNLNNMANLALSDPGLNVSVSDRVAARSAMEGMNNILREAAEATGATIDGRITREETLAMSNWIRNNRYEEWNRYHGDDGDGIETGFHRIQNDGGTLQFNGTDFVDGVVDSIYHLGYENDGKNFLNEDGDKNVSIDDMTDYLNQAFFGDFRNGLTNDNAVSGKTEKAGGADKGEKAGGVDKGEKTEGADKADKAYGSEKSDKSASISEILDLLQKLLNGEELTPEEMAKLAQALQAYMKDGKFDIEAFKADLEKAGLDSEQIEEAANIAENLVMQLDEASGGNFGNLSAEEIAQIIPEISLSGQLASSSLFPTAVNEDQYFANMAYARLQRAYS